MANKYVKAGKKRELAGIAERFASALLDGVLIMLIMLPNYIWYFIIAFGAGASNPTKPFIMYSAPYLGYTLLYMAISYTVSISYFTLLIGGKKQATLGMRVLGIRAVRTNGTDLTYGRAFLRWLGTIVSSLGLYLGWLWILIDKNRQGWHDKIADVYIVRK